MYLSPSHSPSFRSRSMNSSIFWLSRITGPLPMASPYFLSRFSDYWLSLSLHSLGRSRFGEIVRSPYLPPSVQRRRPTTMGYHPFSPNLKSFRFQGLFPLEKRRKIRLFVGCTLSFSHVIINIICFSFCRNVHSFCLFLFLAGGHPIQERE